MANFLDISVTKKISKHLNLYLRYCLLFDLKNQILGIYAGCKISLKKKEFLWLSERVKGDVLVMDKVKFALSGQSATVWVGLE
jgi:hypothetical protein